MYKDREYHVHTGDDGAWTVWQARYGIAWKVVCHCRDNATAKWVADALGAGRVASVTFGPDGLAYPLPSSSSREGPSSRSRLVAKLNELEQAEADRFKRGDPGHPDNDMGM